MKRSNPKLGSRLLIGAIAGIAGTVAMTAAMRRLHERLPARERDPLPPRETVEAVAEHPNEQAKDAATAAHFAYGAASGALLGVANVMLGPVSGGLAGVGVWLGSYMGWIPGMAASKPPRRNLLMLSAHIIWGVTTARAMRELVAARATVLDAGEDRDAHAPLPQSGGET